jgi:hypothetical protein
MFLVMELFLVAAISPFVSGALLLVKGISKGIHHGNTIDDKIECKDLQLKRRANILAFAHDRLDGYVVMMRSDIFVDDAVRWELERRLASRRRSGSRRGTV